MNQLKQVECSECERRVKEVGGQESRQVSAECVCDGMSRQRASVCDNMWVTKTKSCQ